MRKLDKVVSYNEAPRKENTYMGEAELKFHTFLTSTPYEVTGQLHAPAVLRERGPFYIGKPVVCMSSAADLNTMTKRKIPATTWDRTPAVHPVSSDDRFLPTHIH
jgi:hypothetical protein